jgi:hypothetical protein
MDNLTDLNKQTERHFTNATERKREKRIKKERKT